MGTASYMSPEQARGKLVDKRTDIWAFGCCLYEALSGRKSFDGETVTDILTAVVHQEPAWERVPSSNPASVARLLRRCFAKNTKERLHDIADARLELKDALTEGAPVPTRMSSTGLLVLGAVALASLAVALWSLTRSTDAPSKPLARYAISLPANQELAVSGAGPAVAISPDGQTLAWIGRSNGTAQLYLRRASELEPRPLEGTEGARDLFFFPDGHWLGFTNREWLMKISISGGAPVRITEQHYPRGATWAPDGSIVFSDRDGLHKVSADGGTLAILITPDRERREKGFRFPDVLPDGNAVVFTAGNADMETWDDAMIAILSLDNGEIRTLIEGGTNARYSSTGHIVYARGQRLLAVPFDASSLEVTGTPVVVLEPVSTYPCNGTAKFAISRDGSLLDTPGGEWDRRHRVVSVDRAGETEPLIESLRYFMYPHVSPDGQFLALSVNSANVSIWTYSFSRDTLTRLVSGFNNGGPKWSPDGRRLAFMSDPEGRGDLFWIAADGSGQPEPLDVGEYLRFPESWSPGADFLLYVEVHPRHRIGYRYFVHWTGGTCSSVFANERRGNGSQILTGWSLGGASIR